MMHVEKALQIALMLLAHSHQHKVKHAMKLVELVLRGIELQYKCMIKCKWIFGFCHGIYFVHAKISQGIEMMSNYCKTSNTLTYFNKWLEEKYLLTEC